MLWLLFAAAMVRGLHGPIRGIATCRCARDFAAFVTLGCACAVLALGLLTGSSTLQRTALAITFFGVAALALPATAWLRCAGFAGFLLLCFGVPYSAYFALTKYLAHGLGFWLALPAGVLDYRVEGLTAVFPHFRLTVTGDCSGFNQLVTFLAVAALGILVAAGNHKRSLRLVLLATGLAYAANVVRIYVLLALVAGGATSFVTDDTWHQITGLAVDLPFLVCLVWVIFKSHVATTARNVVPPATRRGVPLVLVGVVQFLLVLWLDSAAAPDPRAPAWLSLATAPPQGRLVQHAISEEREKVSYGTPWLVNARYTGDDGTSFDLFVFETRSRQHLNVHSVANCLEAGGSEFRYGAPFELDGRLLYPFEIRGPGGARHGCYLFRVGGEDRDDTWRTQFAVLRARLAGGVPAIGMVRVIFPGASTSPLPAAELRVLRWAAGLVELAQ